MALIGDSVYNPWTGELDKVLSATQIEELGFVPYTGATTTLNLGSQDFTTTGNVGIGTTPTVPLHVRRISPNDYDVAETMRLESNAFNLWYLDCYSSVLWVSNIQRARRARGTIDIPASSEAYDVGMRWSSMFYVNGAFEESCLMSFTAGSTMSPYSSGKILFWTKPATEEWVIERMSIDENGVVKVNGDFVLDSLKSKSYLGTDADGKVIEATLDLSGYVPYTGANANLNLGTYTLYSGGLVVGDIVSNPSAAFQFGISNISGLYRPRIFGRARTAGGTSVDELIISDTRLWLCPKTLGTAGTTTAFNIASNATLTEYFKFYAADASENLVISATGKTNPAIDFSSLNLITTGTLGAGAITGTSFTDSDMTSAGFMKNTAGGVFTGGNSIAIGDVGGLLSASSPLSYNSGTGAFSFLFNTNNTWTGTNTFNGDATIAASYIQKPKAVSFEALWNYVMDLGWSAVGWSDDTVAASESGGTPFKMASDNGDLTGEQEYLYFGMADKFAGFAVPTGTGSDGGIGVYEYWNGSAWKTITPIVNLGRLYAYDEVKYCLWNPDDLTGWVAKTPTQMSMSGTPNDSLSKYWVRYVPAEGDPEGTATHFVAITDFYIADYYPHALSETPAMRIPADGSLILSRLTNPDYETASGGFTFDTGSTISSYMSVLAIKNNGTQVFGITGDKRARFFGSIFSYNDFYRQYQSTATQGDTVSATEGATLAVGDFVYIDSSGKAQLAKADSVDTMPSVGVCTERVDSGLDYYIVTILLNGVYKTTGLTAGATYYISASTAGDITSTKPSSAGNVPQIVGVALSSTSLLLNNAFNDTAL